MKQKLYLIDGMYIAFKSYYAMAQSNLINKNNEPIGAIFGFVSTITSLLEKLEPQNIAVCFDSKEKTFRHKLYSEYKANRVAFPEELRVQLPYIKDFLDLIGVNRIELPGYEADDIIGTYCKNGAANNWEVYCWTTDKDFYQLLENNVNIIRPSKVQNDFEIINVNDVKGIFGVAADEVVDYLALIGDNADNVPGVKGIGEKTAIPLIEKYKTIENIYANIENIDNPRLKKLLETGKENAYLSKKLVTIDRDVPIETNYDCLERRKVDYIELDNLFSKLGLRQHREKWKSLQIKDIKKNSDSLF